MMLRQAVPLVPMPHVHPDQPLELALRLVYEWPMLPVVHRADFRMLVGIVTLDDIMGKYREAARQISPEQMPLI